MQGARKGRAYGVDGGILGGRRRAWIPAGAGMTGKWGTGPPMVPPPQRGDGRNMLRPYGLAHTCPSQEVAGEGVDCGFRRNDGLDGGVGGRQWHTWGAAARTDSVRPPMAPPLRRGDGDSRFRGNDGEAREWRFLQEFHGGDDDGATGAGGDARAIAGG